MDNFMDRLYSKLSIGTGQQYSSNMEPRRRENGENKVEQLMNLMRENDSKQLECIAAMFNQESEEHEHASQALVQSVQEMRHSLQSVNVTVQGMEASLRSISDTIQQMQTEQSYEQPVAGGIAMEQLQDLEEHVHKENVKCYRNVQASVMEQAELQMEQTRTSVGPVKGMLITSLILNVATIALLIVHFLGVL